MNWSSMKRQVPHQFSCALNLRWAATEQNSTTEFRLGANRSDGMRCKALSATRMTYASRKQPPPTRQPWTVFYTMPPIPPIPPMPPPPHRRGFFFSGSRDEGRGGEQSDDTDAACWRAVRTTLVGSITPSTRSSLGDVGGS